MPDPFYPHAVQVAGANRAYRAGRITRVTTGIRHYTVGVNSIGTCGRDFQFLQARDGVLFQGAEVDAVNWGAGDPWNRCSVHIEAEWHPTYNADEPVLNAAMVATQRPFLAWLESEWGIRRDASYHGPDRLTSWAGFIDHRWLIQSGDWHYNLWPPELWPTLTQEETVAGMQPILAVNLFGLVYVYDPNAHTKTWIRSPAALSAYQSLRAISGLSPDVIRNDLTDQLLGDAREINHIPDPWPTGGGGGTGGATPAQVEEIVAADGAKTRTAVAAPRALTGQVG